MQTKPTPESVAATAGYLILTRVWFHLSNFDDRGAIDLIDKVRMDLMRRTDGVSLRLARVANFWRTIDLAEWREDLREEFDYAVDVCLAGASVMR